MAVKNTKRHLVEVNPDNYRQLKAIRRKKKYLTMPALLNVMIELGIDKFFEQQSNGEQV